MLKSSIFSLLLRILTLASKFILTIMIARKLGPEELGVYGLLVASIGVAILFIGFDYYVYNTREILKTPKNKIAHKLCDQLIVHLICYVALLPALYLIFLTELLPSKYVVWFYVLVVLEHISQELYRLLITLSRPVAANVAFFLRNGSWAFVAIILLYFDIADIEIPQLLLGWTAGVFMSICVGFYFVREVFLQRAKMPSVNWGGIKKGVKSSSWFLTSTLALRLSEIADRFWIQYYHGDKDAGIYILFFSIANMVQTFIYTGIISILYPSLISAYQDGRFDEYSRLMKRMAIAIITIGLGLSVIIAILIYPILNVIGREEYIDNIPVFWAVLIAANIYLIGLIPHYSLYVRRMDGALVISNYIGFAIVMLFNFILTPVYGGVGAAGAAALGYLSSIAYKVCALYFPRRKKSN